MKPYLFFTLFAFTINAFGQVAPGNTPGTKPIQATTSSKITVSYEKASHTNRIAGQPKYYINNTFYGDQGPIVLSSIQKALRTSILKKKRQKSISL